MGRGGGQMDASEVFWIYVWEDNGASRGRVMGMVGSDLDLGLGRSRTSIYLLLVVCIGRLEFWDGCT